MLWTCQNQKRHWPFNTSFCVCKRLPRHNISKNQLNRSRNGPSKHPRNVVTHYSFFFLLLCMRHSWTRHQRPLFPELFHGSVQISLGTTNPDINSIGLKWIFTTSKQSCYSFLFPFLLLWTRQDQKRHWKQYFRTFVSKLFDDRIAVFLGHNICKIFSTEVEIDI